MDKINDFAQTVELMDSRDYKERFIAEYCQLEIRIKRLERVLKSVADNTCPRCFTPTCPITLLEDQFKAMTAYREILVKRALIEELELPEVDV